MRVGALLQRQSERVLRQHLVAVNFVPTADPQPRYGFGRPVHAGLLEVLEGSRERCAGHLATVERFRAELLAIAVHPGDDPRQPAWDQTWLPPLDGATLYAFVRDRAPRRVVEVGSGWSTRFIARAVADGGLATEITSIDPEPRAEIDELCARVLPGGLETVDLSVFDDLKRGDVVFVDNSHRAFTNSDVTVFFLDVLPRLPDGVLVGIHDVTLPADYPPGWFGFHFNEQYLLACYLLAGAPWLRVELGVLFAASDPALSEVAAGLSAGLAERGVGWFGSGFWLTVDRSQT
jgi:predicted O-methyltransferase YrrM